MEQTNSADRDNVIRFVRSLGIPPTDCSVYCDRFVLAGYEDIRHIKEFMSLHELLNICMKIGHLKRFLVALVSLDTHHDNNTHDTGTDMIISGSKNKRFEIIDRIVENITAENVALWFSRENVFDEEVNQKIYKFLAVDNYITGKGLNDVNVLTRLAHGNIDTMHLIELSHRFQLHHMNILINEIVSRSGKNSNEPLSPVDPIHIEKSYSPTVKPLLSETFNQFKQGSELELPTGFPYDYNPTMSLDSLATPREEKYEGGEKADSGKLKLTSVLPILPLIPLKNLSLHQNKSGYVLLKEIGRGSCGVIHLALFMPNLKPFALKFIELSDPNKCKQLVKELQVIQKLSKDCSDENSRYILRLFDYFHDHESNIVTLVLEYMGGGSLQRMIDLKYLGSERDVSVVALSILHALQLLHSIGIIHRDIKPGNILVSSNGAVKLADFGVSSDLNNDKKQNETFIGTLLYMSPERIKGLPYGACADIWALGVCLYVYTTGQIPFRYSSSYWDLVETISGGLSDSSISLLADLNLSEAILDFILLCTKTDPSDRAPINDLLQHTLFQVIRDNTEPPRLSTAFTLTICDIEIIDMVDLVLEWQLENMNVLNINTIGHIPEAHIEDLAIELGCNSLRMHSIFQLKSKNLLKFLQPLYSLARKNQPKFQEIVSTVKNKSKLIYLIHILDKLKATGVAVMNEADIISNSDIIASDIPETSKTATAAERIRQRTQKLLNSIYKDSYRFEVGELADMISPTGNASNVPNDNYKECNHQSVRDDSNNSVLNVVINKENNWTNNNANMQLMVDNPDALTHSTIDNIIADIRGCNEATYSMSSHKHASHLPPAFHTQLPQLANYELNCIALPMALYLESPLRRVHSTDSLCGSPKNNTDLMHYVRQINVNPGQQFKVGGVVSRPRFTDRENCEINDCPGCDRCVCANYGIPRINTEAEIENEDSNDASPNNIFTVVNQNYKSSPTESDSSLSF